jgi:DNA-directed RNA polymerase subunit RPC12/RpoP
MNTKTNLWFSLSAEKGTVLRCVECGNSFDLEGPSADQHPAVCPVCGVECVYLDWKGRIIQIVLKNAPPVLVQAIRIMQERFDELEYVEFLVALEELADALYKPAS